MTHTMTRLPHKLLALSLCLALPLMAPAQALTLKAKPAQQLNFSAGRGVQPVAFNPDGTKLLTLDSAGLTLWQAKPLRSLWRVAVPKQPLPIVGAAWDSDSVTLLGGSGTQQVRLSLQTGQPLQGGNGQSGPDAPRQIPAPVQQALGLKAASNLHQLGQGIWQVDPRQPMPFEIMGGQLLGFYALSGEVMALKRPGYAPIELWRGGKVERRLDTVFPALGTRGTDTRFTENLTFSPDGRWLAWSAGRRVSVWDTRSGQKVAVLRPDPYAQESDEVQVAWAPDSTILTVYSMRAIWRYQVGQDKQLFGLLDKTPAPEGALIRMATGSGLVASGTGTALLLSQVGSADMPQTLGPVPERVFFGEDGKAALVLSWPTLWVFKPGVSQPLTLRLPSYAEAAWLTLKGDQLTVYGRNLAWTPGTQPTMAASIWTGHLADAGSKPLPLTLQREDERLNCGEGAAAAGQWLSAVLEPVRLCQQDKQVSGYQGLKVLWTQQIDQNYAPNVTPDGRWFATQSPKTLSLYRSNTGALVSTLALPALPPNTYWNPTLRVDGAGHWAALQAGQTWYLADLKAGKVEAAPELQGAADLDFAAAPTQPARQLAVNFTDHISWYDLPPK